MKDALENFGSFFRLITPALIAIIGTLILSNINDMKVTLQKMDTHFTNHLNHHQDLEVGYERRLTELKTRMDSAQQWRTK